MSEKPKIAIATGDRGHDQGHIAAKLLAPSSTAALAIGSPILFSSVAHGSAHDIAGNGIDDPTAMVGALLQLSNVKKMRAREGQP
jgi:4-hydroxy-L-threonine phosphate dehydrogenase PdxA